MKFKVGVGRRIEKQQPPKTGGNRAGPSVSSRKGVMPHHTEQKRDGGTRFRRRAAQRNFHKPRIRSTEATKLASNESLHRYQRGVPPEQDEVYPACSGGRVLHRACPEWPGAVYGNSFDDTIEIVHNMPERVVQYYTCLAELPEFNQVHLVG